MGRIDDKRAGGTIAAAPVVPLRELARHFWPFARAMIRQAPLIVLDEPTTGLDAESAQRIL